MIDDVDQNAASDGLQQGLWVTVSRDVLPGFHKFTWAYTKYANIQQE
jgi:hypothetical protein